MSARKKAVKFSKKEDSVNLIKNKSKICIQPRFAKHTESSLRKIKIPIKLNKRSSTSEVKKLQDTLSFSRLSGISKKQSKIIKQRQSMQALKTILKQEKQRRTSDLLQDNKLTGTICQPKQYAENLLVSLQGDLIKYSPKNCAKSPAKSQAFRHEVSSIRSLSMCPQDNIKSISDCSRDHTVLNITCKLQSQLNNDEENFANSSCKIEILRKFRLEKATEEFTEFIKPTNSIETIEPVELVKPKRSTECIESAEFTELIKSTGFTESTEPTKPTETVEPTESKKSIECIESAESIEPIKFIVSTESTKPIESTECIKSTKPIKYTALTETTEPVEPKKSTECIESAEFTELIKFIGFTESTEPINPTETVEPTESKKSIECIESAESIEPIKFIESTESKKSIEHTEPTESIKFTELTESTEFTESTELAESAEDCFNNELEEQLLQQNISMNLSATTNYRKLTQETLIKKKHGMKNEFNLKLARNSKFKTKHFDYSRNEDIKPIINSNVMFNQKKGVLQKNSVFTKAQRVWKPPSVKNSSHVENMYMISSTQSTLRKPSQLAKKYLSPTRDEYAESFDNELSAFILRNQCNEMKENKDPCVNSMTKICESLIELKQQQRVQNTGTSKKKKSANKNSKILKNYNDIPKSSKSEPKSRHWQTRLVTPTRFSKTRNDIEQHHPNQISKKSKPLDVIHALKGIIKNMKEHEHADVDAVSVSKDGILNREDTEFLTLPNEKTFSKITRKNNPRFTKYWNKANQSVNKSHKSVNTQTTLNSSLHPEIDSNNGLDSKEILKKSTQTVAIQTSLCCNKNVVDVACNTIVCNVTCKNVAFYDLVDSMNMKAKIDSIRIPNKLVLEDNPIQTNKSLSAESVEVINADDQCSNDNERYLLNEKTLSKMSLKLNNMESDAQCEDVADFELTAERARNLYEAIIIYRSIMLRKFERRQEKYALDVWNGSLKMNRRCNALAFSAATEKFSISRENLLPFVHCILCIFFVLVLAVFI